MTSVSVTPGQLQIGDLVHARGREWIVLAKPSEGLLRVRPLSGSEDDAILIAPRLERQPVREASFALPNAAQLDTQDAVERTARRATTAATTTRSTKARTSAQRRTSQDRLDSTTVTTSVSN